MQAGPVSARTGPDNGKSVALLFLDEVVDTARELVWPVAEETPPLDREEK